MATKRSAGILVFRRNGAGVEVLLAHPGGPYWSRRDEGAWSIPKGEYTNSEPPRDAAAREWTEELGLPAPTGPELELGTVRLPSGKRLTAWAVRGDLDPASISPGTIELEWPPRSGRRQSFPEVDQVGWFDPDTARVKLARGQAELLDRLITALNRH